MIATVHDPPGALSAPAPPSPPFTTGLTPWAQTLAAMFEEERKSLGPLPASVYESYQEGRRRVQRDSFVEVAKAYYEAPPEFIGRQVWARWDGRMVRLFNERMEQIGCHARHPKWCTLK